MSKKLTLTATDMNAVMLCDSNYINNKGAKLYKSETYDQSLEYFRLAAAMGNIHAVSTLGYCYLYGRSIRPNLSLALAYFRIAAMKRDVDAAYKLGDIFGSDKWGVKDAEMSVYYYRMAASFVLDEPWETPNVIAWNEDLERYPSLCYALGRELSPGGAMYTDLDSAYQFLKKAEIGYKRELANGSEMYRESYNGVLRLLAGPQFDDVRRKYDPLFDNDADDEETIDE